MPAYDYACQSCGHRFEVRQSMSDAPISQCPQCQQDTAKRQFSASGVIFKGSGFYVNDSKSSSSCGDSKCGA